MYWRAGLLRNVFVFLSIHSPWYSMKLTSQMPVSLKQAQKMPTTASRYGYVQFSDPGLEGSVSEARADAQFGPYWHNWLW